MRKIKVDADVFAAIWSLREEGESNENQILKRFLIANSAPTPAGGRTQKVSDLVTNTYEQKEVKTSECSFDAKVCEKDREMGKIRWVDDIQAALIELGGRASLSRIYQVVEQRRREGARSLPRTLEAVVRRTLEDHSSDSANFRAADLFALVGRGEWALRSAMS